ncbi:MAG: ABC transporter substrate-binding protein [Deltaproteobacteria bacterium]|nr:ABC transporter substrate-binding protein [Deltaproteobacteria bacterium]
MKYKILMLCVGWHLLFPFSLWGEEKPIQVKPTIKIAVIANFSVPNPSTSNPYGGHFLNGVQIAIDEYNTRSDSKFQIQLVTIDHGDVKMRALDAVQKGVELQTLGAIGFAYSDYAMLATLAADQKQYPIITPSATADNLAQKSSYLFQASFNDSAQGTVLAQYAAETLADKRVAIIEATDCTYCLSLSEAFQKAFAKRTGISNVYHIAEEDRRFQPLLKQIIDVGFKAIMLPLHGFQCGAIVREAIAMGYQGVFLVGDGWGGDAVSLVTIPQGSAVQVFSTSQWTAQLFNPRNQQFVRAYHTTFGKNPNNSSALSYDAAQFLLRAVDSLSPTSPLTKEALHQALVHVSQFETLEGRALRRDGKTVKPVVLFQHAAAGTRLVKVIQPHYQ